MSQQPDPSCSRPVIAAVLKRSVSCFSPSIYRDLIPIFLSQLKCSGKKTGCHRCEKLKQTCTYVTKRRKNKDTKLEISDKARRSSTSTTPSSASLAPISSPHPEVSSSVLETPNFTLSSAPDQENALSINTDLVQYGPLEYRHLQNIPAMQIPDLSPRQNGDSQQPPWSEPPGETYPAAIKVPRWESRCRPLYHHFQQMDGS